MIAESRSTARFGWTAAAAWSALAALGGVSVAAGLFAWTGRSAIGPAAAALLLLWGVGLGSLGAVAAAAQRSASSAAMVQYGGVALRIGLLLIGGLAIGRLTELPAAPLLLTTVAGYLPFILVESASVGRLLRDRPAHGGETT